MVKVRQMLRGGILLMTMLGSVAYATTTASSTSTILNMAKKSNTGNVDYLYVIEAKSGVVTKNKNGTYELVLSQIDPKTLYFSDRPNRIAGYMKTSKFMEDWTKTGSSFEKDPPNVAITHSLTDKNKNGFAEAISLELKHPQVQGDRMVFDINNFDQTKIKINKVYLNIKVFID